MNFEELLVGWKKERTDNLHKSLSFVRFPLRFPSFPLSTFADCAEGDKSAGNLGGNKSFKRTEHDASVEFRQSSAASRQLVTRSNSLAQRQLHRRPHSQVCALATKIFIVYDNFWVSVGWRIIYGTSMVMSSRFLIKPVVVCN